MRGSWYAAEPSAVGIELVDLRAYGRLEHAVMPNSGRCILAYICTDLDAVATTAIVNSAFSSSGRGVPRTSTRRGCKSFRPDELRNAYPPVSHAPFSCVRCKRRRSWLRREHV